MLARNYVRLMNVSSKVLGILCLFHATLEAVSTAQKGCPFRKVMTAAEIMHSATLNFYNDTADRQIFEVSFSRQRRDGEGFLSGIKSYVRHCVKPVLSCRNTYPSFNGICNNVVNSRWGSTDSCLLRILPAHYRDGVSVPVDEVEGLPSASHVSVKLRGITRSTTPVEVYMTHLFFAFGQFLDHDLANSVISLVSTSENSANDCCLVSSMPQCSMALNVSVDPFYQRHGVGCINFVRAARCPCSSTKERQQMNRATPYIDLSQVYGNDKLEANLLKSQEKPYLLDTYGGGVLLPLGGKHCVSKKCFRGADSRINQQAALTSLHTIFLRYHNHLAKSLRKINYRWTDNRLFSEARRINIAQYQIIIIKEFLPLLLGEVMLQEKGISFYNLSYGTTYDDSLEAGMFNEFLTAAFRLHTMIPEAFSTELKFKFFNVDDFFSEAQDYITHIVETLVTSSAKSARFPVSNITTHHIYDIDGDFGLDLVAVNIQRGRDHGLRPYIDYLAYMRNLTVEHFDDLHKIMSSEAVKILRQLYRRVSDIDLYVGGYLERQRYGVLSATMASIVIKQFDLLIRADRFFVTHGKYFTRHQLQSIMNSSLAGIICATTNLDSIPDHPLRESFPKSTCKNADVLNIDYWLAK